MLSGILSKLANNSLLANVVGDLSASAFNSLAMPLVNLSLAKRPMSRINIDFFSSSFSKLSADSVSFKLDDA